MTPEQNPNFIIIAGPNGAGKTTTADFLLPQLRTMNYINADNIAKGLSPYGTGSVAPDIMAGKIALKQIKTFIKYKQSFALESTLSGKLHANFIKQARDNGFKITILYVYLNDVSLSLSRVKARVQKGGHNIPPETIKQRYPRGLHNIIHLYRPLADELMIIDNSGEKATITSDNVVDNIIYKKFGTMEKIPKPQLWNQILERTRYE